MASLSGVSSSNTVSSLMNSANMISGLASGLDTESMIENLVKGYQTKITQLNQKITKTEWKQEAYRSIISKMYNFSNKYTSYSSNTNLRSSSFFNSAVKVLTKGEFADSVSASGKTSSDIQLNAVHQLAQAAQYRTKSNLAVSETGTIDGKSVDLANLDNKDIELSNLKGSLTLTYGSKTVSINFDEKNSVAELKSIRTELEAQAKKNAPEGKDPKEVTDADVLAKYINNKLADEKIVFNNGESESADKRIEAYVDDKGNVALKELGTAKNGVYISGASGNIADQLGLDKEKLKNAKDNVNDLMSFDASNIKAENGEAGLTRELSAIEYMAEKGASSMNISVDGVTKTIKLPEITREVQKDADNNEIKDADGKTQYKYYLKDGDNKLEIKENMTAAEKQAVNKAYTDQVAAEVKKNFGDKVTVSNGDTTNNTLKLKFDVGKDSGSSMIINSDVGDAIGIGDVATSYLNTNKTLDDLMGDKLKGLTANEDGTYDFTINDVKIGSYTKDTKLSDILSDINKNEEAGVKVAYSQTTQSFTFTAKETGANSKVKMGDDLASAIFGVNTEASQKTKDYLGLKDGELSGKTFSIDVGNKNVEFSFNSDDGTVQQALDKINTNLKDQGIDATASFDKKTGALVLKDSKGNEVEYTAAADDQIAGKMKAARNSSTYTAGQDAKFTITVNGETKEMTRSSNSVEIDGLTVNMSETFNSKGTGFEVADKTKSVSFQSKTDSDKIIDVIKSMVDDYNAMMSEIRTSYSTMPYQKSDGSLGNYEPLTDDDKSGMSESAIERYEEKAKQGLLFGDQDLSAAYSKLTEAFAFSNTADIDTLKDMGISVGYSVSGGSVVQIDEDKLRSMLDSDPDRVADLFTKTDGIMDRMNSTLETYAKTTGEPKGILVQKSGTPLSSLSLLSNQWQDQIDDYNTQIDKWQTKLEAQVEKYTKQFTRLETLINQMNSQSSSLQSMLGG